MIQHLNDLLSPLDSLVKKYRPQIGVFLVAVAFATLPLVFLPEMTKDLGGHARNVLMLVLFLPILARVFRLQLAMTLIPLRKELGILMGVLAFVHSGTYILAYPTTLLDSSFWWDRGTITFFAAGFIALILTAPLLLTSNVWSMKMLGKKWKILHRAAYGVLVFTILHVALISWYK